MTAHWLIKSEPGVYSIDDLAGDKTTAWEGVRNYQARNFLRAMKKGDRALFYHSSAARPAVVGAAEVAREAYPDPAQFDPKSPYRDPGSKPEEPRWSRVDVRFLEKFPRPLSLEAIRGVAALKDMVLVKRGRLSVQPVKAAERSRILKACGSRL